MIVDNNKFWNSDHTLVKCMYDLSLLHHVYGEPGMVFMVWTEYYMFTVQTWQTSWFNKVKHTYDVSCYKHSNLICIASFYFGYLLLSTLRLWLSHQIYLDSRGLMSGQALLLSYRTHRTYYYLQQKYIQNICTKVPWKMFFFFIIMVVVM